MKWKTSPLTTDTPGLWPAKAEKRYSMSLRPSKPKVLLFYWSHPQTGSILSPGIHKENRDRIPRLQTLSSNITSSDLVEPTVGYWWDAGNFRHGSKAAGRAFHWVNSRSPPTRDTMCTPTHDLQKIHRNRYKRATLREILKHLRVFNWSISHNGKYQNTLYKLSVSSGEQT